MSKYQNVLGTLTLNGLGFLCLHQKPMQERWKTYHHYIRHQLLTVEGFAFDSAIKVNRPLSNEMQDEEYYVSGYVCRDCGHIDQAQLKPRKDYHDTNDVFLARLSSEPWMTDSEWTKLFTNKN